MKHNNITNPVHYRGEQGMVVTEVQENFLPRYEKHGVMVVGNMKDIIKYILRAPLKNGLEDLKKASNLLKDTIARIELEEHNKKFEK